jgi:hypothetical protein
MLRLYQDHSFEEMFILFFAAIKRWIAGYTVKHTEWTIVVISALSQIFPKIVLGDESRFETPAELLVEGLLGNDSQLWKLTCSDGEGLMAAGARSGAPMRHFLHHFLAILEGLLNRLMDVETSVRQAGARILFLMQKYAREIMGHVIREAIEALDSKYREDV